MGGGIHVPDKKAVIFDIELTMLSGNCKIIINGNLDLIHIPPYDYMAVQGIPEDFFRILPVPENQKISSIQDYRGFFPLRLFRYRHRWYGRFGLVAFPTFGPLRVFLFL